MTNDDKAPKTDLKIPEPPPAVRALLDSFKSKPSAADYPVLPGFSATGKVSILFYVSFLLPLTFMVLKSFSATLASEAVANKLVYIVSFVWPVAATNYDAIKIIASEQIAINYAAFVAAMLVFLCIVAIVAVREMIISEKQPVSLAATIGFFAFSILLAWFAHYANAVEPAPRGRRSFYIDDIGFYYFKQHIVLIGASFAVFMLAYLGVWLYRHFRPAR